MSQFYKIDIEAAKVSRTDIRQWRSSHRGGAWAAWALEYRERADRPGAGRVGAGCTRSRASELLSNKRTCSQGGYARVS